MPVSAPPPTPPAAVQTLAFRGAALGLTLEQWRSSPFPGRAGDVAAVCSNQAGAARIGLTLTPAEAKAGALACTYAFMGADGPGARKPVPIREGLMAEKVRYVFRNDRLARISYAVSADAFDDIVARIDAQIGQPAQVQRDTVRSTWGVVLPRVRLQWRSPAGWATVTDPSDVGGRLTVTYTLPAPPPASKRAA